MTAWTFEILHTNPLQLISANHFADKYVVPASSDTNKVVCQEPARRHSGAVVERINPIDYRAFILDDTGDVQIRHDFEAMDNAHAVQAAQKYVNGYEAEVATHPASSEN
jgi:hypothetical protein